MRSVSYCTAALVLALALALPPAGAAQSAPSPGPAAFSVFVGGREIGREQVNLARSGTDWILTATSRIGAPLDVAVTRFELKYDAGWQPLEMKAEARIRAAAISLSTSFGLTTAVSEITQNGVTNSKTDQISARTIVLPTNFFAAYEALAARLPGLAPGAELAVYVAPQAEIRVSVRAATPGRFQTPAGVVDTTRYSLAFHNPGGELLADVSVDGRGRFARLEIAGAGLLVVRQDLASVASRQQTARNPTDADVRVPSSGFSLAATLTTPPQTAGRLRSPAFVLVPGTGPLERDSVIAGIPLFAQLAGDLAARGFVVLRYDKRGVGQSGGRVETVTLQDYADDVVAAVRWLEKRPEIDRRRIAIAGHGEGAAVALLAAAREKKIAAAVLAGATGTRGTEAVLEQQQYSLELLKTPESERASKIELQKKIVEAAASGKGLEALPAEIRERVDSPWYRSLLLFDPGQILPKVRQPLLILHGELDKQVPPHHAQRLETLAAARKKAAPAKVALLPGLNHLLVPARTGEMAEYTSLAGSRISPDVASAIADWLAASTQP